MKTNSNQANVKWWNSKKKWKTKAWNMHVLCQCFIKTGH